MVLYLDVVEEDAENVTAAFGLDEKYIKEFIIRVMLNDKPKLSNALMEELENQEDYKGQIVGTLATLYLAEVNKSFGV
jgi:predicted  nucleic acid-binding Zn ribbon protein